MGRGVWGGILLVTFLLLLTEKLLASKGETPCHVVLQ
jgi:hypothetical protein